MKKSLLLLTTASFLLTAPLVSAANNEAKAQAPDSQKYRQLEQTEMPPSDAVQNQNQVKTQNAGEDSQLQVNTQELEQEMRDYYDQEVPDSTTEAKGSSNKNSTAQEHMSVVAQKVQELLTIQTTPGGKTTQDGIGEQVRQVAKEQQQAQDQIKMELNKVDSRNKFLKSMIGPDYKALKALNQEMEQNQLRIQQLEQIKTQLSNQGDLQMVQEAIEALTAQNTSLQDMVQTEESTSSLLGWLFKMLAAK